MGKFTLVILVQPAIAPIAIKKRLDTGSLRGVAEAGFFRQELYPEDLHAILGPGGSIVGLDGRIIRKEGERA